MVRVFLSLGSNLGNRGEYLRRAIQGLTKHGLEILEVAGIYETEPREVTDQPWFLNTVVRANTNLEPRQLMEVCLGIERENERVRIQQKSARTLDIDIVFYGDQIVHEPGLTIPHPRFRERKFVLIPLAEIAADQIDPVTGRTVEALLAACLDTSIVRLQQVS